MQGAEQDLERICANRIAQGSKSFAFASTLFARRERRGAFFLYAWCRAADDAIDQVVVTTPVQERRQVALDRLAELKRSTAQAFEAQEIDDPAFQGLRVAAHEFRIPSVYAEDLLAGMEMDVELDSGRFRFQEFSELRLYCYRVAGAVGILMSYVMGISDSVALDHAAELGIAMQLTNISRDVMEDARNGRVYLPASWLLEEGLEARAEVLLDPVNRPRVHRVILRCLEFADRSYKKGEAGLPYLSWRAAFAVAVASAVYRAIGRKLRRVPSVAYTGERVFTTRLEKLSSAAMGAASVLRTLPGRFLSPWRRIDPSLGSLWRYQETGADWEKSEVRVSKGVMR